MICRMPQVGDYITTKDPKTGLVEVLQIINLPEEIEAVVNGVGKRVPLSTIVGFNPPCHFAPEADRLFPKEEEK